jgi:hypothetical protein
MPSTVFQIEIDEASYRVQYKVCEPNRPFSINQLKAIQMSSNVKKTQVTHNVHIHPLTWVGLTILVGPTHVRG